MNTSKDLIIKIISNFSTYMQLLVSNKKKFFFLANLLYF